MRTFALADLEELARDSGTSIFLPDDFPLRDANGRLPFPQSPAIDYGRCIERTPWFVLRPDGVNALRSSVRWLSDRRIPFTTRGSAHSSGGQVLIDRGAVLDLAGLSAIDGFDPGTEQIAAQGGARWHDVVTALAPLGRVPAVWTDNLQTTVAGTLSVGGFGDTTSRYGLQIDHVAALSVLTLDGAIHDVGPGHPLFEYTLAGCGQLGIIVAARVQTLQRRLRWMGVRASWSGVSDYVDDMTMLMDGSAHEVFRGNLTLGSSVVDGFVGDLFGSGTIGTGPWPRKARLREVVQSAQYREAIPAGHLSGSCTPALELVLPLDAGLAVWEDVHRTLVASDVVKYFPGASVTVGVFRGRSTRPLAPLPGTGFALGIGLRPSVPPGDLAGVLHVMHRIGAQVLDSGGRIYMMSVRIPHPEFLERQFGLHRARVLALKRAYDPHQLLNPGLFVP